MSRGSFKPPGAQSGRVKKAKRISNKLIFAKLSEYSRAKREKTWMLPTPREKTWG